MKFLRYPESSELKALDARLRGHDLKGRFKTYCETINVSHRMMTILLIV